MIYVIMGVSGCGKSALGAFLSDKLGWPLYEGDDFHPKENVEKMSRGEPLTDQDRFPWLLNLHNVIVKSAVVDYDYGEDTRERCSGSDAIVICSALKHLYRQILLHGTKALPSSSCPDQELLAPTTISDIYFLFLYGDYELIHQRMIARRGHFMRAAMLETQFSVLEPPLEEDNVLPLHIRRTIADIAVEIERHLLSLKLPVTR